MEVNHSKTNHIYDRVESVLGALEYRIMEDEK